MICVEFKLTSVSYVIVLEVITAKSLVLDHAELDCLDHGLVIIELVISEVDLLQGLRN